MCPGVPAEARECFKALDEGGLRAPVPISLGKIRENESYLLEVPAAKSSCSVSILPHLRLPLVESNRHGEDASPKKKIGPYPAIGYFREEQARIDALLETFSFPLS